MSVATTIEKSFSTVEAAKALGITESLVRRYIRDGRIEAETLGERTYLIPQKSLDAFKKIPRKPGPRQS